MKTNTNISQELLERVERFYNGTMSKQESLDFELQLSEDSEFKTQVEDIKTLIFGIENQSLKEQLDVFHDDFVEAHPKSSSASGFFTLRKLAAAVVILLAITGYWWFDTPEHEKLYRAYFTPDPGLPTTMSSDSNFEFYDAMVNYKRGEYKIAIEKWESIATKNDTLNYFLGVAHLANKKHQNAISFLEASIDNPDFPLLNDAYYYLSLAHLKEGDVELAKKYLSLSSVEQSKSLLSELENH